MLLVNHFRKISVISGLTLLTLVCSDIARTFAISRHPPFISRVTSIHIACNQGFPPLSLRGGGNLDDPVTPRPCINLPDDESNKLPKYGLLFMDQFCHYHGGYLASKARDVYGVATVHALSTYVSGYLSMSRQEQNEDEMNEDDEIDSHLKLKVPSPDEFESWMKKIPFEVLAVICESDSGLDEAELLSEAMNVRYHNSYNPARRDKFLMNESLSKEGLRTVKQKMCKTLDEAIEFAQELGVQVTENEDSEEIIISGLDHGSLSESLQSDSSHFGKGGLLGLATNTPSSHLRKGGQYCVIKPKRGVASDDVFLCANVNEVKTAFQKIQGTSVFGSISSEKNDHVLVQEFASGTEYAVDIVSKNGQHKVAALWRYDKRQANGAPFVYFATELVDSQTPEGELVCDYATQALDVLGLKHGLTHSEFILDERGGVRLVEVNCRQHNTNFAPLAMAAIGYNALDMLLGAYLGDLPQLPPETEHLRLSWDDVPERPTTRACGAVVHLVCYQEGELVEIKDEILNEIESLPSVYAMEIYDHFQIIGNHIQKTIDIRSDCGWVHLINDDQDQFKKDYDRIVELMPLMFVVKDI